MVMLRTLDFIIGLLKAMRKFAVIIGFFFFRELINVLKDSLSRY